MAGNLNAVALAPKEKPRRLVTEVMARPTIYYPGACGDTAPAAQEFVNKPVLGSERGFQGEGLMGRPRQPQICCSSLCRREIQPWEKGISITMFAQTLGMGTRRTSKSERIHVCPQCAVRIASEKEPTKTAPVDLAFFRVLLDLAGAEITDVILAAAELLQERRQRILYPPALPAPEILPPLRALKSAS